MMASIISLFLSIVLAIFPFLNVISPHKSIISSMKTVTVDDSVSDIILLDEDGAEVDESIFYDEAEDSDVSENPLPSAYDSRDYGIITDAKAQGHTGCCWAFAAVSAAETSMIKKIYGNGKNCYDNHKRPIPVTCKSSHRGITHLIHNILSTCNSKGYPLVD